MDTHKHRIVKRSWQLKSYFLITCKFVFRKKLVNNPILNKKSSSLYWFNRLPLYVIKTLFSAVFFVLFRWPLFIYLNYLGLRWWVQHNSVVVGQGGFHSLVHIYPTHTMTRLQLNPIKAGGPESMYSREGGGRYSVEMHVYSPVFQGQLIKKKIRSITFIVWVLGRVEKKP